MSIDETHIPVGGDFSRIFDHKDYLAMISIRDEAACMLRAHLILEEVLNLWSSKLTKTEDLYSGTFVPFKTKLVISKNLGLPEDLYASLDKINEIRNRFSHRKGYEFEQSTIDSLKNKIDSISSSAALHKCENFQIFAGGIDQHGNPMEIIHSWKSSENRVKFLIAFIILMLKLTYWIQEEFHARGISFELITATPTPADNS